MSFARAGFVQGLCRRFGAGVVDRFGLPLLQPPLAPLLGGRVSPEFFRRLELERRDDSRLTGAVQRDERQVARVGVAPLPGTKILGLDRRTLYRKLERYEAAKSSAATTLRAAVSE